MHRLTIDPSINDIGLAYWYLDKWGHAEAFDGCLKLSVRKSDCMQTRLENVQRIVNDHTIEYDVDRVYIEWPRFMPGYRGMKAANAGHLVLLVAAATSILNLYTDRNIDVTIIEVNEWKGQLSKSLIIERVHKVYPDLAYENITDHEYDAIGIGLYVMENAI